MNNLTRWAVPPLAALALYWPGLMAWFQKDDFVWLSLRGMVHNAHELWWALFAPLAQGTIRTLSERVFFMSFYSLFGLHAFPYRLLGFVTFAASLVLMNSICARLTGSPTAGFWAAILWTVNACMGYALSWTALYPELLCAFVFLLSFRFLLRYIDTGEKRFYIAQWITFALGFGVLELNLVYPALALAYAICCARRVIPKVIPLFILSAVYTFLHLSAKALPSEGPYKMYWNASMVSTLWTFWKMALGPNRLIYLGLYPSAARSALAIALMLGLFGFLVWKLLRREWVAAFFPAWFVIVLSPLLPLRDHIDDSYLTIPLIGLAMWGAWALVSGWRTGGTARIVSVALAVIYVGVSLPVARVNAIAFRDNSHKLQRMILSVVGLSRADPGKIILLKGVDRNVLLDAIYERPFRLFGIDEVYVVPEDECTGIPGPLRHDAEGLFLDRPRVESVLNQSRAVVYDISSGEARDVTREYRP